MTVRIPLTGTGSVTADVATDTIGGLDYQLTKVAYGEAGGVTYASTANPLPVTGTVTAITAASATTIVTVRSDTFANLKGRIEGNLGATEGVSASGSNPFAIGGVVNTAIPTSFASGQVGKAWLNAPGSINISVRSVSGQDMFASGMLPVDASGAIVGVSAASSNTHVGVTPTGGAAQAVTAASATFTAGVTPTQQVAQAVTAASATFTAAVNLTGASVKSVTALSATVQQVSAAACTFYGAMFMNVSSAPAYIQVFAVSATTDVSLGVTVPTFVIPVPVNSTAANGAAFVLETDRGISITKGMSIAATTTATGSTGPSAALTGFVQYI